MKFIEVYISICTERYTNTAPLKQSPRWLKGRISVPALLSGSPPPFVSSDFLPGVSLLSACPQ